jgi:cell division protein FtsB
MKAIIIALIFLVALLQYEFWFAKGSVRTAIKLKHDISAQAKENQKLDGRNVAIAADIKDLKKGNESIEEHARNDLGMVKEGETFYRVVDKAQQNKS